MSTISQSIPNLLLGISQQPDNRKRPGQVKDAQNVFPDFALGMLKRPGGKFVAKLDNAETRGKWFPILRDGTEKYIGQYDTTDSLFRIWNLSDGIRRVVDMGSNSGQPSGCSIPNLVTTFTNVANAKHALNDAETALQVAASDLSKKTLGQMPTLKTVFATDFRKYSNPRSELYAEQLKEEVKSGVFEIDSAAVNAKQAKATVEVTNTLTDLSLTAGGTGYQDSAELTFNGSGSDAAGALTLAERGTFAGIEITNSGEGYAHEPIVSLTGDLATVCHPKCTMTGPWDRRYATADEPTKVVDIQLNPGKQIDLTRMVAAQSENGNRSYYIDGEYGYQNHTLLTDSQIAEAEVFHRYGTGYNGAFFFRKTISGTGQDVADRWYNQTGENVRVPEPYLYHDRYGTLGDTPEILIKPQDLTNVHTIRVYGVSGGYDPDSLLTSTTGDPNLDSGQANNGLLLPTYQDSAPYNYRTQDPYWCELEFYDLSTVQPNFPYDNDGEIFIRFPGNNRNNSYLLRDCQRPALFYGDRIYQINGQVAGNVTDYRAMNFPRDFLPEGVSEFPEDSDDLLPLTVPAHTLDERDKRYGYTDVVVPAEFRQAGVGMRIRIGNSKSFVFTTMHLLEDLPAQINDCTITLTKNTIQTQDRQITVGTQPVEDEPDPTTPATARVLINKAIVSADLTAAGTGYQDGQQTTTTVKAPSVDSFNITNTGEDYESVPTINITGGGGTGATATATLSNRGRFKRFNITNGGSGYTSAPTVTLGGTLVGRTATATITGDAVTSITLDANTLDVNAADSWLTAVNPNPSGNYEHVPKQGVTINAPNGNGIPRRNIDTENLDPSGTGFAIGNHLLFDGGGPTPHGNALLGNDDRWVISKPINTTLSKRIRVRAICGTDSSTDGSQNGGFMKRYKYRTDNEIYQAVSDTYPSNSNKLDIASSDAIRVYFHIGNENTTSFDLNAENNAGHPSYFNWTVLEDAAVSLTHRGRSGTELTDYYVDLPELARGEYIVFMFAQDADLNANPTDGSINLTYVNTSEVGITEIEFEDTDDYVIADSVASGATVAFSGGGGTDAAASVVFGKKLDQITSTDAGSGFTGSPSIAFTGGNPTTPAAASTLFFGSGATVDVEATPTFTATITEPGKGYKSATATLAGGGGSGAEATVKTTNGLVTDITFTGGDSNYLSDPTITLSAPNTDNPRFEEIIYKKDGDILTGVLSHVEVKKSGQGLTASSATNVATTTNGEGTGATVDLTVIDGQVTAVSLNTNGTGYVTDDEIYPTGYDGVIIRAYGIAKGTERTFEHPVIASEGYRVFELDEHLAPTNTAAELTAATTAYTSAKATRDAAITTLSNAGQAAGIQGAACAISSLPDNTLEIKEAGTGLTDGTFSAQTTTTTGSGTNMTVDVIVASNKVTRVDINAEGTGYAIGDVIILDSDDYRDVSITEGGSSLTNGTPTNVATTAITGSGQNMTVDITVSGGVVTAASINTAGTGYRHGDTVSIDGYNNTVLTFSTVELEFGHPPYLKDATPEDIEFLTLNDYTFVLNKKKTVAMKPATSHSTGLDANRAQVVIQIAANSTAYKVLLTQGSTTSTFSHTSPASGANADSIAAALTTAIDADANYSATQVGAGVYITSASAFSVETRGGSSESAIYAVTDSISNQSLLPRQSKDGYVVKIVNSEDLDIDDMYVKFISDGDQAFGTGNWEETVKPGLKYEFDALTLPHQLVRQADGTFTYSPVDWNDRLVGDDETNPEPSFVGNVITHIFFYRNRMGFLSGQNVILSKAGDLFNFWNTSAQTATNDDPIDISAAGKRPAFLNYVEPTSVGLVLYATNEQFLLSTDSDILAPTSAKVNSLSAYECEADVESVSLGTTQAFISKTPLYTRLFELTDVTSEQPPLMADITNVVPELIPESIDTMVSSPALSVVSLGTTGSSTLYQYRFLARSRDERLVNCWYKWDLTGSLLTQFFDSSTFFTCVSNGNDVYVQSYDMTQSSEEGFLTLPTGEKTDVCLDLFDINPVHSYDSATDRTRIELPYDAVAGKTLNVVVLGGFIGDENVLSSQSVGAILEPTIQGTAGNQFVEINGDFQGRDLIIGFNYDMSLKLPQLYRYSESGGQIVNDDVSSLILHRIKVKTGLSGPVDYKVSITGLADFTETVSVTQPNQYQLNNVNMQASSTHVVPVFQRNENLAIEIIGNTPFPVSLLGLDWEGKLNQRFYRRG